MTVRDAAFRTIQLFMLLREIKVGIYLLINSDVAIKNRYKYVNKYFIQACYNRTKK